MQLLDFGDVFHYIFDNLNRASTWLFPILKHGRETNVLSKKMVPDSDSERKIVLFIKCFMTLYAKIPLV